MKIHATSCHICGETARSFEISDYWMDRGMFFVPEWEKIGKDLLSKLDEKREHEFCLDCLSKGKWLIGHETACGNLTPEGISGDDTISPESIQKLLRTPWIDCPQDEFWLVCDRCDEFMGFIGFWTKEDFIKRAPDDPQGYFKKICAELDSDTHYEDLYCYHPFIAFQCAKCGKYFGYANMIDNYSFIAFVVP